MIITVSSDDARSRRFLHRLPNGTDTWLSGYVGVNVAEQRAMGRATQPPPAQDGELYPVAYLVEQAASTLVQGHFHRADQFQVFVSGEGSFGKKALTGVDIHYAGAFSPYAPISAGDRGLEYFTFRNGWDPGARWMPDFRAELLPRLGSQRSGLGVVEEPYAASTQDNALDATSRAQIENVMPLTDDGLGAWFYRLEPGASVTGPDPAQGRGQFWLVLRGECALTQVPLGERAVAFIYPDEPPVVLTSIASGARVVVVQFPRRA